MRSELEQTRFFHGRRSPPTSNLPRPSWEPRVVTGIAGPRRSQGPVTAVEPATPAARRTRGHECHPHLFPDTPQRRPPCPSRSRCRTHRRYTRQPSRPIYRLIGISRVCRPEAERASRPAMWRRSVGLRMRFLLSSATVLGDLRTDPVRPQQVSCHSCDGGQRSPDGWVLPSAPPRRPQFRRTAAVRRGIRRGTFRWGNRWRPRRRTSRPTPTECECSCGPDAGARTSGASPFGALQRQRRPPCERRRPASEGEGAGEFPGNLDSCPVGVTKTRTGRRYLVYLSITVE